MKMKTPPDRVQGMLCSLLASIAIFAVYLASLTPVTALASAGVTSPFSRGARGPAGRIGSRPRHGGGRGVVYATSNTNLYAFTAAAGAMIWRFKTSCTISSPVVARGVVFVTTSGGDMASCDQPGKGSRVYALKASTGRVIWSSSADNRETGFTTPVLANGVVYVAGGTYFCRGGVYAFKASTGSMLWTSKPSSFCSLPIVSDGTVYAASGDGHLYAFHASQGSIMWQFKAGRGATLTPAVSHGLVFEDFPKGVYALKAATGAVVWRRSGSTLLRGYEPRPPLQPCGSKCLLGCTVHANLSRYRHIPPSRCIVHAVAASSGRTIWSLKAGPCVGFSTPTVANGLVCMTAAGPGPGSGFQGCEYNNVLLALSPANGTNVWSHAGDLGLVSAPVLSSENAYVWDDGSTSKLNARTGATIWVDKNAWEQSAPVVYKGAVYFQAHTGKHRSKCAVTAISALTAKPLWTSEPLGSHPCGGVLVQ